MFAENFNTAEGYGLYGGFNSVFVCNNEISVAKQVSFPNGWTDDSNLSFKVLFKNGHNCTDASTPMTLNGVVVVVNKYGTLIPLPIHEMDDNGTPIYKSLQPNTILEMYYTDNYDGADTPAYVIIGNPIVLSSADYTIYADGQMGDCPPINAIYTQYPQQKSPNEIWFLTEWVELVQYNGAFFRASGGNASAFIEEGGTLVVQANQNKEHNHGGTTGNDSPDHSHSSSILAGNNGNDGTAEIQFGAQGGNYGWHGGYTSVGGASTRHQHSISNDGGNEARPDNYTIKIWKRIN